MQKCHKTILTGLIEIFEQFSAFKKDLFTGQQYRMDAAILFFGVKHRSSVWENPGQIGSQKMDGLSVQKLFKCSFQEFFV